MSKTFFIGDPHFYHENIIKYENRPFQNAEAMNDALVRNWNKRASNNDRVIVVGDFSFGNKEKVRDITAKLTGHKVLIMGNHDGYNMDLYREAGFAEVYKYPIILDKFWIVSHEPMYINENMPYANIFAHVHGNPAFSDYSKQTICVSVERPHMNYGLIEFNEIKKLLGIEE